MVSTPLAGKTGFKLRALLIGERLDLRALEFTTRLGVLPLTVAAGESGCAVLFRYGAVVLCNVSAIEEAAFLKHLTAFVAEPYTHPDTEEVDVRIEAGVDERVDGGVLLLRDVGVERLQVVADILAKSTVLAHYETNIAGVFDRIEPLAVGLKRRGTGGQRGRELLRHIGGTLLIQHKMVGRVEVAEKPDILWERPELERLYLRLSDEYELHERHLALERKLELISRTAGTLLDLLQTQRSLRVEWYIVILIVLEILITLYELFLRG